MSNDRAPQWRPRAVIFDSDGLLVDTESSWTVAYTALSRRRGREFGVEEKALLIGRSLEDASVTLAEVLNCSPGSKPGSCDTPT